MIFTPTGSRWLVNKRPHRVSRLLCDGIRTHLDGIRNSQMGYAHIHVMCAAHIYLISDTQSSNSGVESHHVSHTSKWTPGLEAHSLEHRLSPLISQHGVIFELPRRMLTFSMILLLANINTLVLIYRPFV